MGPSEETGNMESVGWGWGRVPREEETRWEGRSHRKKTKHSGYSGLKGKTEAKGKKEGLTITREF